MSSVLAFDASKNLRGRVAINVPVFFVKGFSKKTETLEQELFKVLSDDARLSIFNIEKFSDLPPLLKKFKGGLVVMCLADQGDLKKLMPTLNSIEYRKDGSQYFIFARADDTFNPLFQRTDVNTVIAEIEPFQYQVLKRVADLELSFADTWDVFSFFENIEKKTDKKNIKINWLMPLTAVEDCWLFSGNQKIEMRDDHWVLRVMGPHSSSGFWKKEQVNDKTAWKWVVHSHIKSPIGAAQGEWYFFGNEPVYRQGEWVFSGVQVSLVLRSDGEWLAERFKSSPEGSIEIAQNSDQALWWLPFHLYPQVALSSALSQKFSAESLPSQIAPEQKKKTSNGFYKIDGINQMVQVFRLGLNQKSPILFWLKDSEIHYRTFIVRVDAEMDCFELRMPMSQTLKDQVLAQAKDHNGVWFFRCFFGSEHVFFQTQILELDSEKIRFKLPTYLFELQRRNDPRLNMITRYRVPVQVEVPLYEQTSVLDMKDISQGGCGLLVPSDKIGQFECGNKTVRMKFEIASRTFNLLGEIRYTAPDTDIAQFSRVGVKFLNITQDEAKFLRYYVIQKLTEDNQ